MGELNYIETKTIITKQNGEHWFGYDYNMNIYRGCHHGCIYCDSRSECYRIPNFDEVTIKAHALDIIREELRKKRQIGVVGTGSMSDPYNKYERSLELSRGALKLVQQYGFGAGITTKSDLIVRDIDVLKKIKEHAPVIVQLTITTCDDALSKKIEPYAPCSSRRFEAIKALSEAGIYVGVMMMPILPFITDHEDNIRKLIDEAKINGAKFIYAYSGVTLRDQQRDYYYEALDRHFPGLREKYIRIYQNKMNCMTSNYQNVNQIIKENCKKNQMVYHMQDIIRGYKMPYEKQQLSLFD